MNELDLNNIEAAALGKTGVGKFAHPNDTLLLVAEVRRLKSQKSEKWFPLQSEGRSYQKTQYTRIPWSVAEKAYEVYAAQYGRGQSLERLAERGGFGNNEMDTFYPTWREEVDELLMLRKIAAESQKEATLCLNALDELSIAISGEKSHPVSELVTKVRLLQEDVLQKRTKEVPEA